MGVGGAGGYAEGGKDGKQGKDHGQHLPAKRYRLTDEVDFMGACSPKAMNAVH